MADVFISYARSTESDAREIGEALRRLGYVVWRDDELPGHRAYAEVIEERLREAKAVVVLWSADAAKSQWVRAEADVARVAGSMVQLSLDGTPPPLPFNQLQCSDLAAWSGQPDHPGWRNILTSIARLTGRAAPQTAAAKPAATGISLAVLAFDNLSGDPEMGYFSDGVSEEILQTVAGLKNLRVIGRSSSFQFRGGQKAAAYVAAKLNVTHVLDGSVRRSGPKVRIAASLVDCVTETSLWSGRFDRDLADVFAVQDEIAAATASALELIFAPGPKRSAIDPEAYDCYLRARAMPLTVGSYTRRAALLEQAVALAPEFAAGWAALAATQAFNVRNSADEPEGADLRLAAVAAAHTALKLEPDIGAAYAALSLLEPPGRYADQEALLIKARALASDVEILRVLADFYFSTGRLRESFETVEAGLKVDPLNSALVQMRTARLFDLGRSEEGYRGVEEGLKQWPDHDWLVSTPMILAATTGDLARADRLFDIFQTMKSPFKAAVTRHFQLVRHPDADANAAILAHVKSRAQAIGRVDLGAVVMLQAIGMLDDAYALFEAGDWSRVLRAGGGPADPILSTGSLFDAIHEPLRRDPRFPGLCARLGLCDYWVGSGHWPDCADDQAPSYDFRDSCRQLARVDRVPTEEPAA